MFYGESKRRSVLRISALKKIIHAVGARPNFIKIAPVVDAVGRWPGFHQLIVHTGQHYDDGLSGDVLADLELPSPDRFLGIGSGTHAEQTGRIMIAFEEVLLEESPDLVIVAGDVNSTLACALAAAKLGIPIAHVESGLRSGDWSMPEEINRVLTDRLSDFLFTHSPEAEENLIAEGVAKHRIYYVGNTMIDSLMRFEKISRARALWRELGLEERSYVLTTLHRPSNVDDPQRLRRVVDALTSLASHATIVFPLHPRTRARLERIERIGRLRSRGVLCLDPIGYVDFLSLEIGAGLILTDSGGIQEEATALGIPCRTFRPNTERPITLVHGTNLLIGDDPAAIAQIRLPKERPSSPTLPLWDGHAGERIATVLARAFADQQHEQAAIS